jgi:hypothetical protein
MRLIPIILGLVMAGCASPQVQRCQRYDALSLTRDNGFAASLDWKDDRAIDTPPERVDLSLTIVRPLRGPIELVHVQGDVETDRWVLNPPDQNNVASSVCWISPPGGLSNCSATLQDLPFYPSGYYYLRQNGNTVFEAGLAFLICN